MDYQIEWAAAARQDLQEIWEYISADNVAAANRVRQKILDQIDLLEQLPRSGPRYTKHRSGEVRHLVVGNYRIFYQVDSMIHRVSIITIRHAARRDPKFDP